jgi:hypothetical protein
MGRWTRKSSSLILSWSGLLKISLWGRKNKGLKLPLQLIFPDKFILLVPDISAGGGRVQCVNRSTCRERERDRVKQGRKKGGMRVSEARRISFPWICISNAARNSHSTVVYICHEGREKPDIQVVVFWHVPQCSDGVTTLSWPWKRQISH